MLDIGKDAATLPMIRMLLLMMLSNSTVIHNRLKSQSIFKSKRIMSRLSKRIISRLSKRIMSRLIQN